MDVLTGLQVYAERVQMGTVGRPYIFCRNQIAYYATLTWNLQCHDEYFIIANAMVIHIVCALVMG